MKSSRVRDISVVRAASPKKYSNLLFSWENQEQYKNLISALDRAFSLYEDRYYSQNRDKLLGLRGELGSEEFYPLVRIYQAKIITERAKEIAEELIKSVYPKSNVYWYLEETENPSLVYCSGIHLSEGFCPSFLARSALILLKYMYDLQESLIEEDGDIWILREGSN